jgi:hypothetical protein
MRPNLGTEPIGKDKLAIPFRGESSPTLREDGEAISEVNGGSAAQPPRGGF